MAHDTSLERRSTILVVDASEQSRGRLRAALQQAGFDVLEASDASEGLALWRAREPACVVMEARTVHDGEDGLAQHLARGSAGRATPLVIVSGVRDVGCFDRAQRAGAIAFLPPPLSSGELADQVALALRLRESSPEGRATGERLRQQRDALLRQNLLREQLADFLVHDLKNPVNTLDLHAQLLLREGTLSARGRDSVGMIRQEVRVMLRLIQDLLDLSKAEEGQVAPRRSPVALEALLEEVVHEQGLRAEERGVAVRVACEPVTVSLDRAMIRRVVENLLENALRYTPPGSAVRVEVTREAEQIELRVADAGPGIPPGLRDRVFDRFVRVEQPGDAGDHVGRGLGLAFCKLAVEAHGGSIRVEDAAPGAIFSVRLPLREAAGAPAEQALS